MNNEKFRPDERIKKPDEFQRVYAKGNKVITKYFVIFYLERDGKDEEKPVKKLGITVTKSVGNAVERNKIKRQIREFFRKNKELFPKGLIVVKARLSSSKTKKKLLREDLQQGVRRISQDVK